MNTTPTPPGLSDVRWSRLIDVCRQMDDRANRGAGPPRPDHDGPCIPWAASTLRSDGVSEALWAMAARNDPELHQALAAVAWEPSAFVDLAAPTRREDDER